jgi:RimJ/RimL family protein N-acetyltransferase
VLLIPPDSPELFQLVTTWLGRKENYQWLDFGEGRQHATRDWLKIAMHRQSTVVRVFTSDREYQPIGVAGFHNVNPHFGTATPWVVLGEKAFARQGYATRAVAGLLSHGFREMNLRSVNAWVVEHSVAIQILRRLRFTEFGRQRQCHSINGRSYDRLWFDLIASEHRDLHDERDNGDSRADRAAVL